MKNVEIARRGNFVKLPPVGAYMAEIRDVRVVEADKNRGQVADTLEMMIEITEGEYKGRFTQVYEDQKERFDNAKYKGVFRLYLPGDESADWMDRQFSNNIWCVQESNPGYKWDCDPAKLKGKKVGISLRKRLYTYNGTDWETTEIGQFETISDVKAGKCRPMKDKDKRNNSGSEPSTNGQDFADVSKEVSVPW